MTPAQLLELCQTQLTVPFLTALDVIGVGETAGRKAYARGDLPFRVIRVGNVLRVPTADLARAVGLTPDADTPRGPAPGESRRGPGQGPSETTAAAKLQMVRGHGDTPMASRASTAEASA